MLAKHDLPQELRNLVERERAQLAMLTKKDKNSSDLWLVTMRKAGTHMMTKFLRLLTANNEQEYNYVKETSDDYRAGLVIANTPKHCVKFGHLPYQKEDYQYHQLYNQKKILLVRDPRDILVSGSHFIPKIFELSNQNSPPPWAVDYVTTAGPFLERYAKLPLDERLTCMITQKVPDKLLEFTPLYYQEDTSKFIPPFDFAKQIHAAADFMSSPDTLVIRFEDLIGPKGGGSIEAQKKCFEKIARFVGAYYNNDMYEKLSGDLYGGSFTFRKGSKNSWKTSFSEKNIKLFEKHFGKDLVQMGYSEKELSSLKKAM